MRGPRGLGSLFAPTQEIETMRQIADDRSKRLSKKLGGKTLDVVGIVVCRQTFLASAMASQERVFLSHVSPTGSVAKVRFVNLKLNAVNIGI
jgi:transcription antitermination factor NusA-like protein